jgi:hypothetical protein
MALLLVGDAAIRVAPQAPQPAPPLTAPAAASARSPRNASYAITARLDPGSRTISGSEILTWRNTSTIAATTLRFHLYYNAWRNTASTWMRERRRFTSDPSDENYRASDWGWIDLTNIRVIGTDGAAGDVTSQLRFVAPDDGNTDDRTVAEVPLGRAVAPGQSVQFQARLIIPRQVIRLSAGWLKTVQVPEDHRNLALPSLLCAKRLVQILV